MANYCTSVFFPVRRPWSSAKRIKEDGARAFSLKFGLSGAGCIVSRLRQDSHGFPIIFPEMTTSNSVSSLAPARRLKGRQETKVQEEMGNKCDTFKKFLSFRSERSDHLPLSKTSYLKYSLQDSWMLWGFDVL